MSFQSRFVDFLPLTSFDYVVHDLENHLALSNPNPLCDSSARAKDTGHVDSKEGHFFTVCFLVFGRHVVLLPSRGNTSTGDMLKAYFEFSTQPEMNR